MHHFIQQIILLLLISSTAATSVGSRFESFHIGEKKNLLRHRPFVGDIGLDHSTNGDLHKDEATASPTVAPSSNVTTITPTPAPTLTPTTSPPTTAEPTTQSPTTAPPSPSPAQHHEWWKIVKLVLKTAFWMLVAGVFFFAFGAAMSNRYRIYYYVRGLWYSFLRKLKSLWRGGQDRGDASSTLNDIIFSDNDLQEGLLMRDS